MIYGSVCSGIEAASVAWKPLGWQPAFFSEIEKFPSKVLSHHHGETPNHGDMTRFKEWPDHAIDLLVGGTPCQSFSVAGLRKGLDDPRGNLMLTYLAIAKRYRPRWLVWENVPGVLSSNSGRDFGTFLGGLGQLGYGWAYRVLDAQYFGVAQRRRRVFVIGHIGNWNSAAAVLFERHSLQGHPAPSREKGQEIAPTLRAGATNGSKSHGARSGDSRDELITVANTLRGEGFDASEDGTGRQNLVVAKTLTANGYRLDQEDAEANHLITSFHGSQDPCVSGDITNPLGRNNGLEACIASFKAGQGSQAGGIGYDEHVSPTLGAADSGSNRTPALLHKKSVRRLTPLECERLQGFPDQYTLLPNVADGPRYKALGNSMAVPVMRWIGERIMAVDEVANKA